MWKENKRSLVITSIITVLPILAGLYFWKDLPEVMATHFGGDNAPNGFSSRAFAVFGLPLFCLAMLWLGAFVTSMDPRKKNISPKMFTLILWTIPLVSVAAALVIYTYNLGLALDISRVMEVLMGLLFLILGNYLPKARQNYTVGIRIPWTLAHEENWNRTHRLGGYLWVAGGLLILVLAFTRLAGTEVYVILIAAMGLVPCLYSLWLHVARGM